MDWGCDGLACRRGGAVVLEGVAFRVRAGEALVLRGPNGAGKTTLLRTLAGLSPPVAGVVDLPADAVAHGAHADGLKDQLTVRENLLFWAAVSGAADGASRALDAWDLRGLADRRAADLSAGQRRRTSLARLTATARPVWLLDEPTVSLDAATVARFAHTLGAHLAGGGSACVATHMDLGLAEPRALDVGRFAATGRATDDPFAEALG